MIQREADFQVHQARELAAKNAAAEHRTQLEQERTQRLEVAKDISIKVKVN